MMTDTIELSSLFEQTELTQPVIEQYADAAHVSFLARDRFETLTREYRERDNAEPLRLGVALRLLGRFGEALERWRRRRRARFGTTTRRRRRWG